MPCVKWLMPSPEICEGKTLRRAGRPMKRCRMPVLLAPFLALASCGPSGGGFSYLSRTDEFTGNNVSAAKALASDEAADAPDLTMEVRCEYIGSKPNAYRDTFVEFSTSGADGAVSDLQAIAIKLNDEAPVLWPAFQPLVAKNARGKIGTYYVYLATAALPPGDRAVALTGLTVGGGTIGSVAGDLMGKFAGGSNLSVENAVGLVERHAADPSKLAVRYELGDGTSGTAKFDLTDSNFRRVLSDCQWHQFEDTEDSVPSRSNASAGNDDRRFATSLPRFVGERKGVCDISIDQRDRMVGPCYISGVGGGLLFFSDTPIFSDTPRGPNSRRDTLAVLPLGKQASMAWVRGGGLHPSEELGVAEADDECWSGPRAKVCAQITGPILSPELEIFNIHGAFRDASFTSEKVSGRIDQLRSCSIFAYASSSSQYVGLRPGRSAVMSGPFSSVEEADAEIERARACGIWSCSVRTWRRTRQP